MIAPASLAYSSSYLSAGSVVPLGSFSSSQSSTRLNDQVLNINASASNIDASTAVQISSRALTSPLTSLRSADRATENVYSLESIRSGSSQVSGSQVNSPADDALSENSSDPVAGSSAEKAIEKEIESVEQEQIKELAARDREVRAHEQAHAAVGGQYAGAPRYEFERGPDGVRYAVGGEVSIDVSKAATPEETVQKAQIVRRAAMAPAEPSAQDRAVAAQASRMEAEAMRELAIERNDTSADADNSQSNNLEPQVGSLDNSSESELNSNGGNTSNNNPNSANESSSNGVITNRRISSYESIARLDVGSVLNSRNQSSGSGSSILLSV